MNRRSIFKLIAGAACAAAGEVFGLKPAFPIAPWKTWKPFVMMGAFSPSSFYDPVGIDSKPLHGWASINNKDWQRDRSSNPPAHIIRF